MFSFSSFVKHHGLRPLPQHWGYHERCEVAPKGARSSTAYQHQKQNSAHAQRCEGSRKPHYEPLWQGSCRGFSSSSCRSCAKRLFWKGLRMGSQSRAGAIFCLRRRSLKNKFRAAPSCGFTSSVRRSRFAKRFLERLQLLQKSCF